jgi:hypothetical protein
MMILHSNSNTLHTSNNGAKHMQQKQLSNDALVQQRQRLSSLTPTSHNRPRCHHAHPTIRHGIRVVKPTALRVY